MDNKNTIIAVVLSLLILVGWETFLAPKLSPPPSDASKAAAPGVVPATSDAPPTVVGTPAQPITSATPTATAENSAAQTPPPAPEQRIRVATPYVNGSISLTGGRFDDITLVNYRETLDPASPEIILLAPHNAPQPYHIELGWLSSDAGLHLPGPTTVWTKTSAGETLTATEPLVLTWTNDQGVTFKRTIHADKEYLFTVEQSVENKSEKPVTVYPYGLVARIDALASKGIGAAFEGPIGGFNGTSKEIKYADIKKKGRETIDSTGGWIGFSDKYWLTAVAFDPSLKVSGSYNYADAAGRDRYQNDLRGDALTAQPGESKTVTGYVFAGAKEIQLLDTYAESPGLPAFDRAIDFGWYWFLTIPFFKLLQWLHSVLGNFGIAILAFSTIVRVLMFPIANKQFKTMNAMKRLQPEMKRLQEKYAGGDKTKMNQELMELYKREKANPLAGCLPIVVQIPVFYALYKVLSVTIEMRHAPFYGWIHDLSAPDPTTILNLFGLLSFTPPTFLSVVSLGAWPIIMGVTMFLQQRLSPAPADPMQARMMMLMPIVITFVLAPYAAGLVIYWAWSNTLGILQQWVLLKRTEAKAAAKIAT